MTYFFRKAGTKPTQNHPLKSSAGIWLCTLAIVVAGFTVAIKPVHSESFREYQVKAVFLYNLGNFVDWPSTAFSTPDAAFTIGILGSNPFENFLNKAVENETIGGRRIEVLRYTQAKDLFERRCQILFVSADQKSAWKTLRPRLKTFPMLTVADYTGFTLQGGMINLRKSGHRIQLEINLDNIRGTDLVISAKLLSLARLVGRKQDQ